MRRLVVASNRIAKPEGSRDSHGGLAVGVLAALRETGGIWFGWNGKVENRDTETVNIDKQGPIEYATTSLKQSEYNSYYKGFSNSVLWPLFHQRPELMKYQLADYRGYKAVNEKFARLLAPLLKKDDVIWIHDYHLIPMGRVLREMGVTAPIGFFLHTPFPPLDLLRALPQHRNVLIDLMHYDLVGFQTETDVRGFRESVRHSLKGQADGSGVSQFSNLSNVSGVYQIGIETESIPDLVERGKKSQEYARLRDSLGGRKLIIGVDRLDYSKGLEHRLQAYERLLKNRKDLQRKIVYLQITPTSRGDVQAYGDLANLIDRITGHIIGAYADFDWMPLRYLNRGFRRNTILSMYNLAKVGYVTPLRDGMNLVAKEYVASQDPEDPGVLVLSKMAGAAAELDAGVIVNPYDIDNVARQLAQAVEMPLDERKDRWRSMISVLSKNNIHAWHEKFITNLVAINNLKKSASSTDEKKLEVQF